MTDAARRAKNKIRKSIGEAIGAQHNGLERVVDIVWNILGEISRQGGYDDYCQDQLSRSKSGARSGGSHNQIPGPPGRCRSKIFAIANGRVSEEMGLVTILRRLRTHLIDCWKTQVVVIVTDEWNEADVDESRQDLIAHQNRGVKLVVFEVDDDMLEHVPNPL